jgi:hypothetical protein
MSLEIKEAKLELNYGRAKIITKDFVRKILPKEVWVSINGKTWEDMMMERKDDTLGKCPRFRFRL